MTLTPHHLGLFAVVTLVLTIFAIARVLKFNPWDVLYALGILTASCISLYFRLKQRRDHP